MSSFRSLLAALAVACAGLVVACATAGSDTQPYGTAAADLTAAGPSGEIYSLPAGATITFAESGGFTSTVPLAQGAATQTFSLPAGSYTVTLSQGHDAAAGAAWTLDETGDAGGSTIQAVLSDTTPIAITVVAGETTSLVFSFSTLTLGNVTFGTGSASTGITLDAGAFALTSGTVTGTASMTVETLDGSAAFDKALKFTGTVSTTYTLTVKRSGKWIAASDQACAPVTATTTATPKAAVQAAIIEEVSGGAGTICFGDSNLSGAFEVRLARSGAPTTATMLAALGDAGTATYEVDVTGFAPEVFVGTTLELASLPEPFTVTGVDVAELVNSGGTLLADITGSPVGTSTVTLKK